MKFEEIQRVRSIWWYWAISAPLSLFGVWGVLNLVGTKDLDQTNFTLIILCSFLIALVTFHFFIGLRTDYNNYEIIVKFSPFFKKIIPWNKIANVYIRKFDWSEFKATGVGAIPLGSGKAYHLFSEYGLQIEMINGDKILIGTRKPKSLQEFLKRMNKL